MSSSPSLEPENSHLASTREASQGFSEAASVAAEDAVAKTPSTRVDAAKEAIAGQVRRLVVPRRSLLLTGGVVAAAGVLAAMPQIAATGVLGEDAAVVVSNEKLLARRERLVRENIDTRYLKIESLGRIYVGKGRSEQDLRLVGSFSLTEAAQADLAAAATALTNLSVYGSLHRLSVTYGGVDSANDPQNVANTATDAPVSPLRVNDSAPLKEEQWLKVLTANAALGTNVSYAQVGLLADELRLNAVVIDENYESLLKRFRSLAELDLKNEQVQQIHLNIQLAPEKALSLPSGAQSKISVSVAESSRVATVADVLSKAATKKELNTLASFSLVWNAREKYPSASQWDAFKLGFKGPESKEESAKEAQRTAVRKYLQEVSGPLQALTKREATVPGEVIT
ncbi:acetamidase [uncultured Rothia sp.]|uniref:acetamidase n=1 Tax=uncultured Rothia sp. TaxID=316088 RepID=UPI0025E12A4F|nr:acetamidase [uncultured Rothia sp.]